MLIFLRKTVVTQIFRKTMRIYHIFKGESARSMKTYMFIKPIICSVEKIKKTIHLVNLTVLSKHAINK